MEEDCGEVKQPRARARTSAQLARQEACFKLSVVRGKTVREIASELAITQNTVVADIRCERDRRYHEDTERRDRDTTTAVGFYQEIIAMALVRADIALTILQQIADSTGSVKEDKEPSKRISDRYLDTAIKARDRIDKLLGLEAPETVQQKLDLIIHGGLPPSPK